MDLLSFLRGSGVASSIAPEGVEPPASRFVAGRRVPLDHGAACLGYPVRDSNPEPRPSEGRVRPVALPGCGGTAWTRRDSHPQPSRCERGALLLSYRPVISRAPEGNRTPVARLEAWCLGPLGHWSDDQVGQARTAASGATFPRSTLLSYAPEVPPEGVEPPRAGGSRRPERRASANSATAARLHLRSRRDSNPQPPGRQPGAPPVAPRLLDEIEPAERCSAATVPASRWHDDA